VAANGPATNKGSPKEDSELGREGLLDAIDAEIAQREGAVTRHGISSWTVIGALVGLFWMALNEALERDYVWLNVALVVFVAHWYLGVVLSYWEKAFFSPIETKLQSPSKLSVNQLLIQTRLGSGLLAFYCIEMLGLCALSAYLGVHGFWQLSALSLPLYLLMLFLLVLLWVYMQLKIPFEFSTTAKANRRGVLMRILVIAWIAALLLSGTEAALGATDLSRNEVRLGLILAGTWSVFGLGLRLTRPAPGLEELRTLRTKLGFGSVDLGKARQDIKTILFGTPQEAYVANKAEQVLAELRTCNEICDRTIARIERAADLSERVRTALGDTKVADAVVSEFQASFRHIPKAFDAIEQHFRMAIEFRRKLDIRIEAARRLLELDGRTLESMLSRVDEAVLETCEARARIGHTYTRLRPAIDYLVDFQRKTQSSKKFSKLEIFSELFRD